MTGSSILSSSRYPGLTVYDSEKACTAGCGRLGSDTQAQIARYLTTSNYRRTPRLLQERLPYTAQRLEALSDLESLIDAFVKEPSGYASSFGKNDAEPDRKLVDLFNRIYERFASRVVHSDDKVRALTYWLKQFVGNVKTGYVTPGYRLFFDLLLQFPNVWDKVDYVTKLRFMWSVLRTYLAYFGYRHYSTKVPGSFQRLLSRWTKDEPLQVPDFALFLHTLIRLWQQSSNETSTLSDAKTAPPALEQIIETLLTRHKKELHSDPAYQLAFLRAVGGWSRFQCGAPENDKDDEWWEKHRYPLSRQHGHRTPSSWWRGYQAEFHPEGERQDDNAVPPIVHVVAKELVSKGKIDKDTFAKGQALAEEARVAELWRKWNRLIWIARQGVPSLGRDYDAIADELLDAVRAGYGAMCLLNSDSFRDDVWRQPYVKTITALMSSDSQRATFNAIGQALHDLATVKKIPKNWLGGRPNVFTTTRETPVLTSSTSSSSSSSSPSVFLDYGTGGDVIPSQTGSPSPPPVPAPTLARLPRTSHHGSSLSSTLSSSSSSSPLS